MILVMKTNLINQKNYIRMFTNIKVLEKKIQILAKTFHLLSSTWTLFFKLPRILGLIQTLASNFKKYDHNNLTFEVHAYKN